MSITIYVSKSKDKFWWDMLGSTQTLSEQSRKSSLVNHLHNSDVVQCKPPILNTNVSVLEGILATRLTRLKARSYGGFRSYSRLNLWVQHNL